jgi:lipopolysaccharide/colanic/teichoic acid biosynthesis glycosyltransferase
MMPRTQIELYDQTSSTSSPYSNVAWRPKASSESFVKPPAFRGVPSDDTEWTNTEWYDLMAWLARPSSAKSIVTRLFDLVVASTALLVLAPLMVFIAACLKLASSGPIIYGSPRLAHQNGVFRAWKFRSMYKDADDRLQDLLNADTSLREEYALYRKLTNDPRITPIGRVLRRTSLDELPQLVNVLMGQMSVVGPRPKLLNEADLYGQALGSILQVKPGLTGLWQIKGRSRVTIQDRIIIDLAYVYNRNLLDDLLICVRTIALLVLPRRSGAM